MNMYLRMLLLWLRTRRASPVGIWEKVTTRFVVAPTDLDPLLHMNNGKYLTLMDLGRLELMRRSGLWRELSNRGWYPVVAGQTISYRRSLKLGQRFELDTQVLGFDDKWGYLEQTFRVGDVVYAHAFVRSRFLKKSGGSVENGELAELVGGFPDHLEVPHWLLAWTEATRFPSRDKRRR